ncbi:hypothetical protein ONS96_010539 [Cadophora gregata f. sp. sojae]|nr:hypothetical protein ONS96_010539 [Cadophora gregata f. sp. sojae]
MLASKPLILFIDAYDSFSNNIISLLETTLNVAVRVIHIDNPALLNDSALHRELRHYSAVVCGPGPGNPENEQDVGAMRRIWRLADEAMVPVLGVCLGFQSLCLEFRGEVRRLKGPQHGIVRRIIHTGERDKVREDDLFRGVGRIDATLYQSLCADIGQDSISQEDWQTSKWQAARHCPDLLPLAWVEHDLTKENNSGIMDKRVLVAVRHRTKPFWALQYHPESICTNDESKKVIHNWFKLAQIWNLEYRETRIGIEEAIEGRSATRPSLLSQTYKSIERSQTNGNVNSNKIICHSRSINFPVHESVQHIVESILNMQEDQIILESSNGNQKFSRGVDVRGRYSIIGLDVKNCTRVEYTTGRNTISIISPRRNGQKPMHHTVSASACGGIWSYLAQNLEQNRVKDSNVESPFLGGYMGYSTYELGLETIGVTSDAKGRQHDRPDLCFAWVEKSLIIDHVKSQLYIQQLAPVDDTAPVGTWMDDLTSKLEATFLPKESYDPFTITFSNLPSTVTKCQILDKLVETNVTLPCGLKLHQRGSMFTSFATARYLQHNDPWRISRALDNIEIAGRIIHAEVKNKTTNGFQAHKTPTLDSFTEPTSPTNIPFSVLKIRTPDHDTYESKVLTCQSSIRAGDSYELCLTDQTHVTLSTTLSSTPSSSSAWNLYTTLCTRQPAPFASYIRLGPLTYISASPERFLSYTPTTAELRPMKGTVRKSAAVCTLAAAESLLSIPKERAENLMIVDLVRHDLHSICGSGNVSVPKLMVVEEYASVYQMISIVQGTIPAPYPAEQASSLSEQEKEERERTKYTGLDILAMSLPPGSMTGAPKKRSCEILQEVEGGKERGLYSGVVGYTDVRGKGDWSVNIRCAFKWEDEDIVNKREEGEETWHIGAGGAVTALSTAVSEREEMLTKLSGTLGLFQ